MFVEDKTSYNGPISIHVDPSLTVAELKETVQCEFEIPVGVQRWILGKSLVADEKSSIASHGVTKDNQKIFLYLVAPGKIRLYFHLEICWHLFSMFQDDNLK